MYTTTMTNLPTWGEEQLNFEMFIIKGEYVDALEQEDYEKCAELLKKYPYLKNTSE